MTINGAHAGDHHACTHTPAGGVGRSRDGILFIRPLDPTSSDSHSVLFRVLSRYSLGQTVVHMELDRISHNQCMNSIRPNVL